MKHTLATTCRDTQRANAFIGERRLVFVRAKLLPPASGRRRVWPNRLIPRPAIWAFAALFV